jgi:hypothetical protein
VSSRNSYRVITVRSEPWRRKAILIRDVAEEPSEKKKWRYTCRLFGKNNLMEGAM